jgi:AcrR family transcriptional regulator
MLVAARQYFLDESYENVGLREIARDAGVDVALVGRYFGSKQQLFTEVLRGLRADWLDATVRVEELPAFLAGMVLHTDDLEDRDDRDRLLIILRSSSSPQAAELVRTAFHEDVIIPVAKLLAGPDAELRTILAFSLLTGASVMRTIIRIAPPTADERKRLETRMTRLLEQALAE